MKIAISLIAGIFLGLGIAFASGPVLEHLTDPEDFASFHGRPDTAGTHNTENSTLPSPAVSLMQTDTALCDQPYFIEMYELGVAYFSAGIENVQAEDFSKIVFDHARNSGYFTTEEAENWISHIKDIPGQTVEIFREDPTLFDNCFNFQVAAVGPPA